MKILYTFSTYKFICFTIGMLKVNEKVEIKHFKVYNHRKRNKIPISNKTMAQYIEKKN